MQKKLLALAVAGVLGAPAVAMAQSAVTISGVFKVSIDNYKIDSPSSTASTAPGSIAHSGTNTSENRITDNNSRLIFGVVEDIGGGMSAIAQVDFRFAPDTGTVTAGGNTWVGLRGTSWGTVTLGRHDLHYGKQPDDLPVKAGALMGSSVSLMDYVANGQTGIANTTRTNNVLRYDSPNWSGFAFTAAYSTNPTAVEGDLASSVRKGNAYTFNPSYTASNFAVGWSYWNQKADGGGSLSDQKSNVFYGYYTVAGFKVGAAINDSKVENGTTGVKQFDRRAWTIPVSWTSGSHNIYAHYTKAKEDKVVGSGSDAKMIALAYVYDLSKRTSVGLTYAKIDNNSRAAYNFFSSLTSSGVNNLVANGEDPRLLSLTVRHAF
jgi:predicted porin